MSYQITLNLPNVAEGADVEVDGLGVYPNDNEAHDIPDDVITQYRGTHKHDPYSGGAITITDNDESKVVSPVVIDSPEPPLGVRHEDLKEVTPPNDGKDDDDTEEGAK
jgi:hypothetical protein